MIAVERQSVTGRASPPANLEHTELHNKVRVLPGDARTVSLPEQTLVTVLGSCVAACIRNPWNGFGGMNHFMLPESETGEWNGVNAAMRYGNHAMEALINMVLKSGCARHDLEIKIFGGANLGFHAACVGSKNVEFVKKYLADEGLQVSASDVGGNHGRRLYYRPSTGVVRQLYIRTQQATRVAADEQSYAATLNASSVSGSIELF
ncbi:chemoreceptor glutamine deamidase CheD [Roseibium sp.]|uniref:chemoreceptor glutamine deamidase CheD n=1 Tax=Roseibium sp. TaxID=1936156 RepID=UPI003A986682